MATSRGDPDRYRLPPDARRQAASRDGPCRRTRAAHQLAADALPAARQAARQTNPNRVDEGDIAAELAAVRSADIELKAARHELRLVREKFSGELAHIIRREVVKLAPTLHKTAVEFAAALALLAEADSWALSKGIPAIGYGALAGQLAALQDFARQLRGA
jgi:hypothetical protein